LDLIRDAFAPVKTDRTQPDRPCGREESTPNRMAPVRRRMSRAQPNTFDCVSGTTANSYLREWQDKPATACTMFSYESDSSCPKCADVYVRKAPTNYRRNPPEQVKAADSLYSFFLNSGYSDEYYSDYEEYSSDPDFDYTDTLCYRPDISNHPGISPQPRNPNQNVILGETGPSKQKLPEPTESKKE
jgi:hypothetical protein